MPRLEAGVKAPAFSLLDQDEKKVALKDLKGKQVVVYFYPADDTPGCTKEACQFNENLTTFNLSVGLLCSKTCLLYTSRCV